MAIEIVDFPLKVVIFHSYVIRTKWEIWSSAMITKQHLHMDSQLKRRGKPSTQSDSLPHEPRIYKLQPLPY